MNDTFLRLGPRFEEALVYAAQLHANQPRKGTRVPYISHLLAVCALVLEDGGDEDEAIAALLHDSAEDAGGVETLEAVRRRFGGGVAGIVEECSDTLEMPKPPWRERKEAYIEHLEHASAEAIRVSLADKLHNVRSILRDYGEVGEKVWERFNPGRDGEVWYYGALAEVFSRRSKSLMATELEDAVGKLTGLEEVSMAKPRLEEIFRTATPARDKFLSRLFGLFSEEVVRYWCQHSEAKYEDLGRPSFFLDGMYQRVTLDFTLRERETGRTFVSELKCELEFGNYRYLRLATEEQLRIGARGAAFDAFMALAHDPEAYEVRLGGKQIPVDGAILVWGAVTPDGREMSTQLGFADVLSIEEMVDDLATWTPVDWNARVAEVRSWSNVLFDYLACEN